MFPAASTWRSVAAAMAVLRFEPIATQLARMMALDELLPARVLEEAERSVTAAGAGSEEPRLREFMVSYVAVTHAAYRLLGAPQFERLSRLHDQIEEGYAPGGPPRSPVYESFSVQHVLADVPVGVASETPFSVLARLTKGDVARAALHGLARSLAESHHDVYRVTGASGRRAVLARTRDGSTLEVGLTGPALESGDLVLARVLEFRGGAFIADAPYLLLSSEADWRAHFDRVWDAAAADGAEAERRPAPQAKLSPKRLARRRKEQKAAQSPREVAVRHLKFGGSERYWLDYILLAYAGERRGLVYLEGVPDRPATLPQHESYDAARAPVRPVEVPAREALRLEAPDAQRVQRVTARYVIVDRERTLRALAEAFESVDTGRYRWLDASGGVLAELEVRDDTLSAAVDSFVRLARVKAKVGAQLGAAVKAGVDVFHGDVDAPANRAGEGAGRASSTPGPAPAHAPEMADRVRDALLARVRAAIDQPLPMFGGKTVRQLADTEQGRAEAKAWLEEQQRMFDADPQLRHVDLRPLWTELGVE